MSTPQAFRLKTISRLVAASLLVMGSHLALADSVDLGTVNASTSSNDQTAVTTDPQSAAYQAPSQGSLTATEPVSTVNQHYIQENMAPGANYPDIIAMTPSEWSIDPNGPGGMETQGGGPYIRGFQDGQYNVEFDGIPWGDSNDFTHHSTSYFMAQDLGSVSVDRGPGDASTIGNATFGGTIYNQSRDPSMTSNFSPFLTLGSWGSRLAGLSYDTGVLPQYGDARAYISYKDYHTNGYLQNANQNRTNIFAKLIKPVGENTVLSFVAMQNNIRQNVPYGASAVNLAKYGNNFGLSEDPNSPLFQGYNYDEIHTDFEYFGIQSRVDGWQIDNKLYTYAYEHNGFNGIDPGYYGPGGYATVPGDIGTTNINGTTNPNDVAGQKMTMDYRSVGDLLRLSHDLGPGTINTGLWYDHQDNTRWQYEMDMTTGGLNYINSYNGQLSAADRLMTDTLDTTQAYIDYAWKPTPQLTITPGVKYESFTRNLNAPVNQGNAAVAGNGLSTSETWTDWLPSLDAHYMIQKNWSAYAQLAEGFQAPNLNVFYPKGSTLATQPNTIQPQTTTNFQVGTTYTDRAFVLSGDVYDIRFNNQQSPVQNGIYTIWENLGATEYKGFELEGTAHIGMGFNLYGNFGYDLTNQDSTGHSIQDAPQNTGAIGVIYEQHALYSSLMTKYVGTRFMSGGNGPGGNDYFSSYTVTNFTLNYTLPGVTGWYKSAVLGLQVDNLFDNQSIYALAGQDVQGNDLFWTLPGRSAFVSITFNM
ncbi:MAG: TonB-dependent receptor [Betaproteobacteria bacterium]|nr:TonB-dependent receptor [Betaproteobacteria bacterium]